MAEARASRDRKRRRLALQQRLLPAGLALLLGGLVLWLAVPRLLASGLLALRDPVLQQMDAGERVPEAELLGLLGSRDLARSWVGLRGAQEGGGTARNPAPPAPTTTS